MHYQDLTSADAVADLVKQACTIEGERVISVKDGKKLQEEVIYQLQFCVSVNDLPEVKQVAIFWINQIAAALKITTGSNAEFYNEKSRGQHEFFTVPAVNSRMMTFHTVRAAVRAARSLQLPHVIFELALSECGYTGQQKDEYAAMVKAAYISLGLSDVTVYLQADHYQLDPKKFSADPVAEVEKIRKAIVKAIENGVYNIDIDTSKFETANPQKSDQENQKENARLTAELLAFIRSYEAKHQLPCVVSVGGEVGEVGGGNTKFPQVNAYLELLAEELKNLKMSKVKGLNKVSINVGSAHGGVLGLDGKPLNSVPLDFQAHHDVFMKASDPLNKGQHVLSVQHGASTLPEHYFPLFPAMHVAEIHLATGFQNIVWDVLEKEDNQLYQKMKKIILEKFADKVAKYKTEALGLAKERKRVTEFVKRDLLLSPAVEAVEKALEQEFMKIFYSLYNIFLSKSGEVQSGDRVD